MSDEYKDRYIIITLLKTPPRYYTDNAKNTTVFPANGTRGGSSSDRTKDLPNTYSRSTAETSMNPIVQNIPVIYLHFEGTSEQATYFPNQKGEICKSRQAGALQYYFLKKSQNAPRPSEHPPVRGGGRSQRLGGIKGCKYKTSSWHINGFPEGNNFSSTV